MDPYLEGESIWPEFHRQFVQCLLQALQLGLSDRYAAATASRADHHEDYIEVRQRSDGRLVTLLDVVSPANKATAAGRRAYLETRREAGAAGASLVEVDLVLHGPPTLEYSRDGLPPWDYAVTVTRSTHPERYEIYTATLQKRLPRFRVPMADNDRDTVLDLQAAFTRCYDEGSFAGQVDHRGEPPAPLSEENSRWVDTLLTEKGKRDPANVPGHDEIARAAYALWLAEGRPHGRDREHWFRAEEQLKRQRRT
jgi:hypothetical protein